MTEPLISVIVPVFKVERYLDRCIESLVNQTYRNLEIILVDDGSPDGSPAICDKWAAEDPRIVVIHKENEGVAAARNDALAIAKGDYIAFADGDDFCFSRQFEILYKNLKTCDADISMCQYYESDVEIDDLPLKGLLPMMRPASECMKDVCLGEYVYGVLWNKLYSHELVKGIQMPPLKCSQDLPYNYFAFKRAKRVAVCDEQLYFYRNRADATTKTSFKNGSFDAIKAREIMMAYELDNPVLRPYVILGYVNSNLVVLSGIIKNNVFMERFEELRSAILKYKKEVLRFDRCMKYTKMKIVVLSVSPSLFKKMTLKNKR